jgi:hypothetical protein
MSAKEVALQSKGSGTPINAQTVGVTDPMP